MNRRIIVGLSILLKVSAVAGSDQAWQDRKNHARSLAQPSFNHATKIAG